MSKRVVADYLQDILDAVAAIEQFTTGINLEDFSQNLEKVFGVSIRSSLSSKRWNSCKWPSQKVSKKITLDYGRRQRLF